MLCSYFWTFAQCASHLLIKWCCLNQWSFAKAKYRPFLTSITFEKSCTPSGYVPEFWNALSQNIVSELMEFQKIIWSIFFCLHFVMTQKSVHIKIAAQIYYIIWCATLTVCSAQWCELSNFGPFGFHISHFPTRLFSPN